MSRQRVIALLAAVLTVIGLGAASYVALPPAATRAQPVALVMPAALALPGLNMIEEIAERGAVGLAERTRLPNAHLPVDAEAQLARARRMEELASTSAATEAERSARAAALIRVREELKVRLQTDADELFIDLAKDFVCSMAWKNLTPDEKSEEAAVTDPTNGTRDRTFGHYFADQTKDALVEVAEKAGYALGARVLGGSAPTINAWGQWANGVVDTATTSVGGSPDGLSQTVNINGYVASRAAFYYAKYCLSPPGR